MLGLSSLRSRPRVRFAAVLLPLLPAPGTSESRSPRLTLLGVLRFLPARLAVVVTTLPCVQLVGPLRLLPLRVSGSGPRLTLRRLQTTNPPPTTRAPSIRSRWRATLRTRRAAGANVVREEEEVVVDGDEGDHLSTAWDL